MNNLQIFENTEFGKIRTVQLNNETYFVGKDVADILGYQNGSRDINRHVDEEDKHKIMLFDGNQDKETIIINESGLYSLIIISVRSRKEVDICYTGSNMRKENAVTSLMVERM